MQYLSDMEILPPRIEPRPSHKFRPGSHGPKINHRPHLQRLHIKFRIRRIHEVSIPLSILLGNLITAAHAWPTFRPHPRINVVAYGNVFFFCVTGCSNRGAPCSGTGKYWRSRIQAMWRFWPTTRWRPGSRSTSTKPGVTCSGCRVLG